MEQITVLKEVDEKIRQSKDKYEISIVSYDVARKHNILFFLMPKHKERNDSKVFEE